MNTNSLIANLDRDNLHFDMSSLCGCGFSAVASTKHTVLALCSESTKYFREYVDVDPAALLEVVAFLADTLARFAAVAQGDGVPVVCSAYFTPFDLELTVSLVEGNADHVRLEATVVSDEHDSLDYCHIGVTVDMSLHDFLDRVDAASRTGSSLF